MEKVIQRDGFPTYRLSAMLIVMFTLLFLSSCGKSDKDSLKGEPEKGQVKFAPAVTDGDGYDHCIALLKDGLRDEYVTKDNVSFFSDAKRYFTSDEFTLEELKRNWGGGVSIFGIGLSADATSEDLRIFKKKVTESTSTVINMETYYLISKSTLNIKLANEFNDCIALTQTYGLSINVNAGSDGKTLDFTVRYKTLGDDQRPRIRSVEIRGIAKDDSLRIVNQTLRRGNILYNELSFTAVRNPNNEMLIAINADNGVSMVKRLPAANTDVNSGMPVGTIITSVLKFEDFNKVMNNNATNPYGKWSPKSTWAPCDGRVVNGSKYQLLLGVNGMNVPDLRGVFLRGLNSFDPEYKEKPKENDQLNPETKYVGQYQADAFGSHAHSENIPNIGGQGATVSPYITGAWTNGTYKSWGASTEPAGDKETRPKNVSVFYYIKIN